MTLEQQRKKTSILSEVTKEIKLEVLTSLRRVERSWTLKQRLKIH